MNLLLDTHAFLWFIDGSPRLSSAAKSFIEDAGNAKWVSAASLWEMAIKISLGRLRLEQPFEQLVPGQMEQNGFALLPLRISHMAKMATLPLHHRDPFDRLLAAQCLTEDLALVSVDTAFDPYAVRRIW